MKLKLYIHKLGGPYIDIDIESFLETLSIVLLGNFLNYDGL